MGPSDDLRTPGPLPPPPRLPAKLPLSELTCTWYRSHEIEFSPIHYGREGEYRFDDPAKEYGVLYVAQDPFGAFIESFGQLSNSAATLPRMISSGLLMEKVLSSIACNRTLRLVDLTGPGLARIGADARLFSGDHQHSRPWSKALREHATQIDGIYYPCRHDPSRRAAAIFREGLSWRDLSRTRWLHFKNLREVLQTYEFALIESVLVAKAVKKGPKLEQTRFPLH